MSICEASENELSGTSKIAVLFEVKPKKEGYTEYLNLAAALKSELAKAEGFLSIERFSSLNEEGKLLSLSFWKDEKSLEKWRNEISHRSCQRKGYNFLFAEYRIFVASVIREYTNTARTEAPHDSNEFIKPE